MNVCTMFDHRYLARGLVLYESLLRHSPKSILYVLCLSQECKNILKKLALPHMRLISVGDLEESCPTLLDAKQDGRSTIEYYFTLSPCLPLFVLEHNAIDEIAYVDADAAFFSSPDAVLPLLGDHAVGIVGHRFPENLKHLEVYGKYNVGFQIFRNTDEGRESLVWWRKQCMDWCRDVLEKDRFADQKYLDQFPLLFDAIEIPHCGINVAPWNLDTFTFSEKDGHICVNDDALIFYHFHGLRHVYKKLWISGTGGYTATIPPILQIKAYQPYMRALQARQHCSSLPLQRTGTASSLRSAMRSIKKIFVTLIKEKNAFIFQK